MARLARLVLPGQAHYVIQRGHNGQPVFADAQDRASYLAALREAAANEQVLVHAYALLDSEVQLLATPASAPALGRLMQALGRHYGSAYNRRHARRGALWDGRFRCAPVEPGALRLHALLLIDGQAANGATISATISATTSATTGATTSAAQHTGAAPDTLALLSDPPERWSLGNTPFEREAAYRRLLAQPLPPGVAVQLRSAALGGWVAGSPAFAALATLPAGRRAHPRQRGRPRGPLARAGTPPA